MNDDVRAGLGSSWTLWALTFVATFWLPLCAEAAGGPSLYQTGFRWRRDDGGETNASWKAAPNYPATLATNQNIRLRVCLEGTAGTEVIGLTYVLAYTDDPTAQVANSIPMPPWIILPAVATTQAFEMASSPWFTNGLAATDQLPGTMASVYSPGCMVAAPTNVGVIGVASNVYSNVEFCFKATPYAKTNRMYRFVLYSPRGSEIVKALAAQLTLIPEDPLGDINGDGVVNEADLNEVISNFGRSYR